MTHATYQPTNQNAYSTLDTQLRLYDYDLYIIMNYYYYSRSIILCCKNAECINPDHYHNYVPNACTNTRIAIIGQSRRDRDREGHHNDKKRWGKITFIRFEKKGGVTNKIAFSSFFCFFHSMMKLL